MCHYIVSLHRTEIVVGKRLQGRREGRRLRGYRSETFSLSPPGLAAVTATVKRRRLGLFDGHVARLLSSMLANQILKHAVKHTL